MKVIDLLNKIANGEEVPSKIEVNGKIYRFDYLEKFYDNEDGEDLLEQGTIYNTYELLNDDVEITDKEDEEIDIDSIEELNDTSYSKHFYRRR